MSMGQMQESFLLGMLLALAAGIAAAHSMSASPAIVWGFSALMVTAAAAAVGTWKNARWTWLAFLAVAFVLGVVRLWSAESLPVTDISHHARNEVSVTGILREEPSITQAADGSCKQRYVLEVEQVTSGHGERQAASGGMYVYARSESVKAEHLPRIGDRITASGKVRLPHGYRNPGQIDTEMLLKSQGITATLSAGKRGIRTERREAEGFRRWLASVREHYRLSMQAVMPSEDAAAIFAMLFGGYAGLQPELLEAFTITGIVHLLSVSGSHISLVAAVMVWLCSVLRLPKGIAAAAVLGVIVVYAMLAGCVPPVIRSAVMGGLAFLAMALDRERDAGRILLLTGLMMLGISPLLLFHISFQLSFLATAGLLYLAPVARGWLQGHGVRGALAMGLAVTFAAQMATLPVLAWYFNQLSLSSFLANLVIVPIVDAVIVIGLLAGLAAFLLPLAGSFFFLFDSLLLGVVYEMARWMAALPGSRIWIPSMGWGAIALYYAALALWVADESWRKRCFDWVRGRQQHIAVLGLVVLFFCIGCKFSQSDEVTMSFVDVGQGDAAVLKLPSGKAVLFDTGGTRDGAFDVGARVLVPYLRHCGIHRVEAIFLTHAHADHAAGAAAVLKSMPVGAVYTADEGREAYRSSMRMGAADPLLSKLHAVQENTVFEIGDVRIEVVYAPHVQAKEVTGNEASNVYRVTYGRASFLITGDLTIENEKMLLEKHRDIRSTVLKVGHHGSDTSTSEAFLRAVAPRYAAIGVGADNSFGHPKPSVLQRLQEQEVKVWRTDLDGEISFCTDGKGMRVETYVR